MGKTSKAKREEKAAGGKSTPAKADEGYEFKLPAFDEGAFIRREVQSARASFYTLGLAIGAGVLATLTDVLPVSWQLGWLPIILAMLAARPMLTRLGFGEEVTSWKALFGSYIMMFFTGLAVWIMGVNIV